MNGPGKLWKTDCNRSCKSWKTGWNVLH